MQEYVIRIRVDYSNVYKVKANNLNDAENMALDKANQETNLLNDANVDYEEITEGEN